MIFLVIDFLPPDSVNMKEYEIMILVVKCSWHFFLIMTIIHFSIILVFLPIVIAMWKSAELAKANLKKGNKNTLYVQL